MNVSPAQSPRVGLLLWGAKVTKAPVGKRLLYAHGHTAQAVRTHRPGSSALLTFAQALPSAKSPMPLSGAQASICSARFWPKLFTGGAEKMYRNNSKEVRLITGQSKEAVARTQKRGRDVDCAVELFCVLIFWLLLDQAKSNSPPAAIERD